MPREIEQKKRPEGLKTPLKMFVLSYEGTVTEKKYFNQLRKSDFFNEIGSIELFPLTKKKEEGDTRPSAVVHRLLKEKNKDKYNKKKDEFWAIVDRDDWETVHGCCFEDIYKDCENNGIKLALSNPCFEIWLLLHLTSINSFSQERKDKIFDNKKDSERPNKNIIQLEIEKYHGRGYNKRPCPEWINNVRLAIERAEELDKGELYPKTIGTDVYKLVQNLIKK